MGKHQCAECTKITNFYCRRCNEWLCLFHSGTHLRVLKCSKCNKDVCLDEIKNDKLCFNCHFSYQIDVIIKKFIMLMDRMITDINQIKLN